MRHCLSAPCCLKQRPGPLQRSFKDFFCLSNAIQGRRQNVSLSFSSLVAVHLTGMTRGDEEGSAGDGWVTIPKTEIGKSFPNLTLKPQVDKDCLEL